jgi:hypothetical protein
VLLQVRLLLANQCEDDILLREQLEALAAKHPNFKLWYTLDRWVPFILESDCVSAKCATAQEPHIVTYVFITCTFNLLQDCRTMSLLLLLAAKPLSM